MKIRVRLGRGESPVGGGGTSIHKLYGDVPPITGYGTSTGLKFKDFRRYFINKV